MQRIRKIANKCGKSHHQPPFLLILQAKWLIWSQDDGGLIANYFRSCGPWEAWDGPDFVAAEVSLETTRVSARFSDLSFSFSDLSFCNCWKNDISCRLTCLQSVLCHPHHLQPHDWITFLKPPKHHKIRQKIDPYIHYPNIFSSH